MSDLDTAALRVNHWVATQPLATRAAVVALCDEVDRLRTDVRALIQAHGEALVERNEAEEALERVLALARKHMAGPQPYRSIWPPDIFVAMSEDEVAPT